MNNNSRRIVSRRTFWCLCLAAGLLFLGAVFLLSRHADMQDCERRMTELIDFVKEQSSSYVQYNETAVAKALVRETTAVQELDGVTLDCDERSERNEGYSSKKHMLISPSFSIILLFIILCLLFSPPRSLFQENFTGAYDCVFVVGSSFPLWRQTAF